MSAGQISDHLASNLTENPRRLRLKKDAFLNQVLDTFSVSLYSPFFASNLNSASHRTRFQLC
jgi:hypothetical protein